MLYRLRGVGCKWNESQSAAIVCQSLLSPGLQSRHVSLRFATSACVPLYLPVSQKSFIAREARSLPNSHYQSTYQTRINSDININTNMGVGLWAHIYWQHKQQSHCDVALDPLSSLSFLSIFLYSCKGLIKCLSR